MSSVRARNSSHEISKFNHKRFPGIPDERLGEEVAAFVRLKDNGKSLTQSDIRDFCKGHLAYFKIPRFVITVDEFPRTLSGKIQKFKFMDVFKEKIDEVLKS